MSFDELVDAILQEQDSVTHYNEEGADVPMRLHQKYRQEAVGSLRDWVKAQVAAEREAIIAICMEAGDTALANKCGEIAGAMYVTVARIRARGDAEAAP